MSLVGRAGSNIARHLTRTLGIVIIVALTLGTFLVLSQVDATVESNANQAVNSVQNVVTVQLANDSYGGGFFTFNIGAGVPPSTVGKISAASGVASIQRVISQPETVSLGGGGSLCGSSSDPGVQAMDTSGPMFLLNAGLGGMSTVTVSQGRSLTASDAQGNGAMVGSEYASQNDLTVGSSFSLNGVGFTVVGIFAAATCEIGGETVIVPFAAGASALQTNNATIVFAYLGAGATVGTVVAGLQTSVGSGFKVQSLANANHNALQGAVGSILSSTEFAGYAALTTGGLIVVVAMVVVTTHRTREFGLMKALGYGNRRILSQVSLESLLVAIGGFPAAFALAILLGPVISQWAAGGNGGPAAGYVGQQVLGGSTFVITLNLVALGALVTVTFGLIGAIYPSLRALRLPPTEALRNE